MSISVRNPSSAGIERATTKIDVSVQSCPLGLPVLSVAAAAKAAAGSASVSARAYSETIRRRSGRPPSA
jgi:hypothetical protein